MILSKGLSRREFLTGLANSLAVLSLLQFALIRRTFAAGAVSPIAKWLAKAEALAHAMRGREITPVQWQRSMEELLGQVDLAGFLKLIDFDQLAAKAHLPDRGESFENFSFTSLPGIPGKLTFYRNFAGFRKDRSIPPHGHHNLVSSFLVLAGDLHGRHFERVRDEGETFLIKPTIDRTFHAGDYSTVSDDNNNVHWFTALRDRSFIFDFGIGHLDPNWHLSAVNPERVSRWSADVATESAAKSDRVYLDLNHKVPAGPDGYRVARISHEEAYRTYG